MKYLVLVCFTDDRIMQFVANNYYNDRDKYIFSTQTDVKIISQDSVKYMTIDNIYL